MQKFIHIFILFCFSKVAFGAQLNSNKELIKIGEALELTIQIDGFEKISLPQFKDTIPGGLEIYETSKIDTSLNENGISYSQTFTVASWDTGYIVIPPFEFRNGDSIIKSNPLLVHVLSTEIDLQSDIKPLKPQIDTPFIFDEIKNAVIAFCLILIGIALIVFLSIFIYRKYFLKKETEYTPPPRPIMEVIQERIENLEKNQLWLSGKEKDHQLEITSIMRLFLEYRFQINAVEETTRQIEQQLNYATIDISMKEKVVQLMKFADQVKFANQKFGAPEHENSLYQLKAIIQQNQPKKDVE